MKDGAEELSARASCCILLSSAEGGPTAPHACVRSAFLMAAGKKRQVELPAAKGGDGTHADKKPKIAQQKNDSAAGKGLAAKGRNPKAQVAVAPGKKLFEAVLTAPPRAGDAASTNWETLKKVRSAGAGGICAHTSLVPHWAGSDVTPASAPKHHAHL